MESCSEAEEEELPEPGVMGKLVLTLCSHTIKPLQGSSSHWELPTVEREMMGRMDCSAPALFLDTKEVHYMNYILII